ncbi:MAG: YIP1 family protein [Alphaproteobacteria bacterium]
MEQSLPSGGVLWRMLGAWADLRGSMRAELDRDPGEGRLLFYVMLSGLIWFFGRYALLVYGLLGPAIPEDVFVGRVGLEFVSAIFFRTLAFYALAALAGLIARAAGGGGGWRDSRAALFWAALVSAPVILAATMLSLLLSGVPGPAGAIASMLGAVAFAWAVAQCVAEAHGFTSAWRVLGAVATLAAAFVGGVYILGSL